MSTVPTLPSTSLFDAMAEGAKVAKALEADVADLLERIVAARRELEELEARRVRYAHELAEVLPTACVQVRARLDRALGELDAYIKARVENPIP